MSQINYIMYVINNETDKIVSKIVSPEIIIPQVRDYIEVASKTWIVTSRVIIFTETNIPSKEEQHIRIYVDKISVR